jgi:hypothetical protein
MKQVTRCGNCNRVVKVQGSFTALLTESPVVNGMQMPEVKRVIKLCRNCSKEAGYKVKE